MTTGWVLAPEVTCWSSIFTPPVTLTHRSLIPGEHVRRRPLCQRTGTRQRPVPDCLAERVWNRQPLWWRQHLWLGILVATPALITTDDSYDSMGDRSGCRFPRFAFRVRESICVHGASSAMNAFRKICPTDRGVFIGEIDSLDTLRPRPESGGANEKVEPPAQGATNSHARTGRMRVPTP